MTDLESIIQQVQSKKLIECEMLNQLKGASAGMQFTKLNSEEKKKLSDSIFENLKKNSEGWGIKKTITLKSYGGHTGYRSSEILIIHKSAKLKYDDNELLIFDRKFMWEKSFFSLQQQQELENILTTFQEQEKNNQGGWGWQEYGLMGGGIVLIIAVIWLWKKYC